jgi:nucleolar protein 15
MAKAAVTKKGKTTPKKAVGDKLVEGRKKGSAKKERSLAVSSDAVPSPDVKLRNTSPSDIIYLGHIPNGFGEGEMRKFFTQYGDVQKLKLFRSKKTKGSKGHAFIKFDSVTTAKTVSESMNGYFMGDRQLVSEVVPKFKCHKGMFLQPRKHKEGTDGAVKKMKKGPVDVTKLSTKANKTLEKKAAKLAELGIDYDFSSGLGDDEKWEEEDEDEDEDEEEEEEEGVKEKPKVVVASKKRKASVEETETPKKAAKKAAAPVAAQKTPAAKKVAPAAAAKKTPAAPAAKKAPTSAAAAPPAPVVKEVSPRATRAQRKVRDAAKKK